MDSGGHAQVRALVDELEKAKGAKQPARAKDVNGKWRLLYTSSVRQGVDYFVSPRCALAPPASSVPHTCARIRTRTHTRNLRQVNTASPIQRGFVGNQAFSVYQLIDLDCPPSVEPTVTNVVDFGR